MCKRKHKNTKPTFEQIRHFEGDDDKKASKKRAYPNTTKGLRGDARRKRA